MGDENRLVRRVVVALALLVILGGITYGAAVAILGTSNQPYTAEPYTAFETTAEPGNITVVYRGETLREGWVYHMEVWLLDAESSAVSRKVWVSTTADPFPRPSTSWPLERGSRLRFDASWASPGDRLVVMTGRPTNRDEAEPYIQRVVYNETVPSSTNSR